MFNTLTKPTGYYCELPKKLFFNSLLATSGGTTFLKWPIHACVKHLIGVSHSCQNNIIPAINSSFVVGLTITCGKFLSLCHRSYWDQARTLRRCFPPVKTLLIHNLFCQPAGMFWILILFETMPIMEFFMNEGKECVL